MKTKATDFDNLENKHMLDNMLFDLTKFKVDHTVWQNQNELWRKFIRSV